MIISSNFLLALILNFLSYNLKGDVLNLLILINLYKLKVWLIANIYHFVNGTYQLPRSACSIVIILLSKPINFGPPTQALDKCRLPFDSLNKISTMISVTRLQNYKWK